MRRHLTGCPQHVTRNLDFAPGYCALGAIASTLARCCVPAAAFADLCEPRREPDRQPIGNLVGQSAEQERSQIRGSVGGYLT